MRSVDLATFAKSVSFHHPTGINAMLPARPSDVPAPRLKGKARDDGDHRREHTEASRVGLRDLSLTTAFHGVREELGETSPQISPLYMRHTSGSGYRSQQQPISVPKPDRLVSAYRTDYLNEQHSAPQHVPARRTAAIVEFTSDTTEETFESLLAIVNSNIAKLDAKVDAEDIKLLDEINSYRMSSRRSKALLASTARKFSEHSDFITEIGTMEALQRQQTVSRNVFSRPVEQKGLREPLGLADREFRHAYRQIEQPAATPLPGMQEGLISPQPAAGPQHEIEDDQFFPLFGESPLLGAQDDQSSSQPAASPLLGMEEEQIDDQIVDQTASPTASTLLELQGRQIEEEEEEEEEEEAEEEEEEEEEEVTAPTTGPARRAAPSRRKIRIKEPPLPIIVRNRQDNDWEDVTLLSSDAQRHLVKTNNVMSRGPKKRAYGQLVRAADTSGTHCVQCQVYTRQRTRCSLNNADVACSHCVSKDKPCAKLIMHNGTTTLAWLPYPSGQRVPGSQWTDKGYWWTGRG